jgi:molybdopterin synthase catalytic subunit
MRAALVDGPLDPAQLLAEVSAPANGAAILFVGTVRDVNEGRAVTGIDYSAYTAMAKRELEAILTEAAARYATSDLVVEHRLGTLEVGEASVAIAVAHARRTAAYDASRFIIEELKRRVPIWKREHYTDGTREWVHPTRGEAARRLDDAGVSADANADAYATTEAHTVSAAFAARSNAAEAGQ